MNAICLPKNPSSFDSYKTSVEKNFYQWFTNESYNTKPLEAFLENTDHGAKHTHQVYLKACEIMSHYLELYDKQSIEVPNIFLIYLMSLAHDAGRFRIPLVDEVHMRYPFQLKRQDIAEKNHARYAVAQIRLVLWNNIKKGKKCILSL